MSPSESIARDQSASLSGFTMTPIMDLRSNMAAAYDVAPHKCDSPQAIGAALSAASEAAASIGFAGPLHLRACTKATASGAVVEWLDAVLIDTGLPAAALDVIVEERALSKMGFSQALACLEALRARGGGVSLELSEDTSLPLGARGRAAVTDIRLNANSIDSRIASVMAAREAGLTVTALAPADLQPRRLLRDGFDRRSEARTAPAPMRGLNRGA